MMNSMSIDIKKIIKTGRDRQIDFISSFENPHHAAALISSFANCEGGTLIVGVNSKGKLIGVLPDLELQNIEEVVNHYLSLPIEVEIEKIIENYKFAFIIHVPKIEVKFCGAIDVNGEPHYFVRTRKGEVFEATSIIEKSWVFHQRDIFFSEEIYAALKELLVNENQLTLATIFKEVKAKKADIENTISILIELNVIDFEFVNQKVSYCWIGNS
jgi:predicted HTH transcriptional regulator